MIPNERTLDRKRYIDEILSIALKCANNVFNNEKAFQQNGAYQTHTPHLLSSPGLNHMDYAIQDKVES